MQYEYIEQHVQLHEHLEVIYVVAGYEARIVYQDGAIIGPQIKGSTVADVLHNLNVYLRNYKKEALEKHFLKNGKPNPDY